MGKRILIPGLMALLLVAGVSAWLVLDPSGQRNGGEAILPALSNVEGGVSGGTPDATANAHRRDADATSVQPGSQAGSRDGRTDARAHDSARPHSGTGASSDSSGAASGSSKSGSPATDQSAGPSTGSGQAKPARSKIIDAARPPNQTLGNARPVSRVINAKPYKSLDEVSEKLKQDRRGLYAQYYAFSNDPLAELAKEDAKPLAQRDAALVRIDNQVYFPNNEAFADLPVDQRNFAATWDGYLVIPEQGEYWLFLGADNAARLDLDGETVLLNDVQSRYIEVSTVLELAPGLHPLRIEFAQGMLANDDSWRCAASFMWVPKGQQKPVAVPSEMLMVPDWMWSDDAPIITKLSKYEGEIGDEITIEGQGLSYSEKTMDETKPSNAESPGRPDVIFNGQVGIVLNHSRRSICVRVPIGASTGRLNIIRSVRRWKSQDNSYFVSIPSNSVEFIVKTQFGLMAQWYDLGQQSNSDFVVPSSRAPDVARIEVEPWIESRDRLDLPFRQNTVDCHWEGMLLIPKLESGRSHVLSFAYYGALKVQFGEKPKDFLIREEGSLDEIGSGEAIQERWYLFAEGDERRVTITIDWCCSTDLARASFAWWTVPGSQLREQLEEGEELHVLDNTWRFFVPPVAPPKPPRIASVIPMTIAGDEPTPPPFPATPGLVSVREGQQFKCNVEIFGDEEVRAAPVTLSVDGHVIECGSGTLIDDSGNKRWFRQFVGVLPAGCGEGKLTAKLGLSTSEPFHIDVANKGLIAYLYDLPNPSGYSQFPNILPLTCHTIRKEREINFGTADSFNLPFVAETFAVEWYGAIIIEQDGWYTFTSRTDDGCRVWLNGIEIIDDDNLHAPQEKSSERIRLVAGTYPFRMQFFENNQHEECLLFVSATDMQEKEMLAKQVVPKRMFTWEVHDALPDKIATGKKADGSE